MRSEAARLPDGFAVNGRSHKRAGFRRRMAAETGSFLVVCTGRRILIQSVRPNRTCRKTIAGCAGGGMPFVCAQLGRV